ncbi:eCIS core domain-containing protein [Cellulomonas sp. URHB0016]
MTSQFASERDTPCRRAGGTAASRAAASPRALRLLSLQRRAGNHAVAALVDTRRTPGAGTEQSHEREADSAAEAAVARPSTTPAGPPAERAAADGLPPRLRSEMEASFGWDLRGVRVHADATAASSAARLGAAAYTVGRDVHLGEEARDLDSSRGRRTLAHELAHVVQQDLASGTRRDGRRGPGLAQTLSPAARGPMAAPTVTAVNLPATAEVGAGGRGLDVTAVAAGAGALTWTLVGGPAGVTITPRGRRGARISATAAAAAGAGGTFQVRAALTSTPADDATSGNVLLVGITGVTVTPAPAFSAGIATAVGAAVPPVNSIDPNRDGVTGNTGVVAPAIAPLGRPVTVTLRPAHGATVAGTTITAGADTGATVVRAEDDGTGARFDSPLAINPVPTRVSGFTNGGLPGAGQYGQINNIGFAPTNGVSGALSRVIGETIGAAGRDDFNLVPSLNGTGPNPVPNLGQSAPGNNWPDNVVTGTGSIDVNQFVGPGAPGLPAVSDNRQGMHWLGWSGNPPWSSEFAHGIQRVSLLRGGAGFIVRTEQIFGGAHAPVRNDPYAAAPHPLITYTGIVVTPNAPAARGLAADGVAQAGIAFVSSTPARTVDLSLVSGSMMFTTPLTGAPVAGPHTVQSGLVGMTARIRIQDSTFANRRAEAPVPIVPVRLSRPREPAPVPAATASVVIPISAAPGGRTLVPTVDTPGFVAVQVAPAVAADAARQIQVTRPGPGAATVRVTIADSVLAAQAVTVRVRFR